MNKTYNNLTIENLIKTKDFKELSLKQKEDLLANSQWFNQFSEAQQEEIRLGIENNVEVSIYAKPEFDGYQMEQIRLGLKKNLDVSKYANPEYHSKKMRGIRLSLPKESTLK